MPSLKRRALLDKATSEYAECVDLARTYLLERGLTDEVIDRWQLGYVLDPLPGHERFKGYLSIPYLSKAPHAAAELSAAGDRASARSTGTLGMKFRCLQEHDCGEAGKHAKYDSEKGAGTFLFGSLQFWVDSRFICVTEGELDAIAADVADLPAVGVSGASKWLPHWQYCFEGYEEVIVLADGDKAGEKLASNVSQSIYHSRVVQFPDGEDVSSFLVKYGPEALRTKVLGAQ